MEKQSTFHQALTIPFEHPVTSLSISPMGREACLAAKRGLYILDLENPFEPPRIFQHISKWDVADVQWNPHVSRNTWIASTSNQKALVWNIDRGPTSNSHVEFMLTKHLRAVSDIHWSPFLPETLATCSYDAYVYLWDLRQPPTQPSYSFCGWTAGATQVKFNRLNEHILASAHDTDVRIWDLRKGSTPVTLITAHMTKIYGIDWSRTDEKEILTCSQDRLVKIWNVDQNRTCKSMIETSSPCWRARFTPFGNGIVTMPQRKDTSLYLWNPDVPQTPAYIFSGHSDVPTEFVWRYQRDSAYQSDTNEYQLVTWSKDMHLRLWPISKDTVKAVSMDEKYQSHSLPSLSDPITANVGRNLFDFKSGSDTQLHLLYNQESPPKESAIGAISLSSLSNVQSSHSDHLPMEEHEDFDLEVELNRLQEHFPGVYIDKSNLVARRCTIRLERPEPLGIAISTTKNILFQVDIIFPKRYPFTPPFFDIQKTWMLSMMNRTLLSRKLTQIAMNYSKKGKPCMEAAIKYLLGGNTIETAPTASSPVSPSNSSASSSSMIVSRAHNVSTDFQSLDGSPNSNTSDDEDFLTMGGHLKTFREKDNHNVPFPRLCGATFAQNGKLVYFTSPLPHPSSTKFTAYTLTTRNQQPILQSQSFATQPKTYALYENYRSFVLARCPRMFIGGVPALQDRIPMTEDAQVKDRKLDYWLDDEDMEDEVQDMYWKPKTNAFMQPENQETFDFLAKLNSFNAKAPATKDIRRNSVTSVVKVDRKVPSISVTPGSSIPASSPISPVTSSIHPRRKSIGAIHYDTIRFSDLGIPFQEKSSPTSQPLDIQPLEMDMLGMIRKAKKLKRPNDILAPIQTTASPKLTPEEDIDDSTYGTTIHIIDLEFLMPISKELARLYKITGNDSVSLCEYNKNVTNSVGRKDLTKVWEIVRVFASLEGAKQKGIATGNYKSYLTRLVLEYLELIGDYQTLSTVLAVLANPADYDIKNPKPMALKPVLTSSLVLGMAPVTSPVPQGRPSKLKSSLYISGTMPSPKALKFNTITKPDPIDLKYKHWIHQYADYLYSLGLYETRAQLLRSSNLGEPVPSLLISQCTCTKTPCECKTKCPYCRLSCKTLAAYCFVCKHGGHAKCMSEWFEEESFCITGCGCECSGKGML